MADWPHPITLLGFGGLPTGGDVAPDGRLVALRTYETLWVRGASERQGEAVAFLDGTLLTVSEGVNPSLLELGP